MATQERLPTANGPQTDWTASEGDLYACVNDSSDTTYISTSNGTPLVAYSTFAFSAFDIFSSAISKVSITIRHLDSGTDQSVAGRLIIGGTPYNSAVIYPGASFANTTIDWATNPKTLSAWTEADVEGTGDNPLQYFGIYGATKSGNYIRVAELKLIVTYTEASSGLSIPIVQAHYRRRR